MPRKAKITTSINDESYQRQRTEALKEANADIKQLPKTAPKHLTGVASRLWTTLVPALNKLGYITVADKSTLEAFCINYSVMREAYENIKDVGAIYENSGRYYKNPATAVLNDATGKVKSLGGEFPVLKVTEIGARVLKGQLVVEKRLNRRVIAQQKVTSAATGLKMSDADNRLFAQLKKKRLELARASGLPPFLIFSDKTLMNMAILRPKTDEEFLAISGVGEKKFDIYHEDFATVIRDNQ
ncbi:Phage terminase small subunit [Weissella jogaejeotgali]|uniref:Phage terminase small subunit n=1 Tax=Weissella jogaejeotgali TaxID=1631871 RepID=A0A1L6RBJ4_9LACO|nr:Phage terminase small subunit [Weissella jogaejeotgali]